MGNAHRGFYTNSQSRGNSAGILETRLRAFIQSLYIPMEILA